MEVHQIPAYRRFAPLILIVSCACILFFYKLGSYSLWESDEPIYAEVARAMAERSELLTPYWNNSPWFIHPPLYFWCTIAVAHFTGWNELGVRFTSAFFSAALVVLTYFFSLTLWGSRKSALLSSLILISSLQVFAQGRMALLDSPLNFFMMLALLLFYKNYQKPGRWYALGFWISCGVATFFKGPLGLFLPSGIAMAFLLLLREQDRIRDLLPAPGLLLYLLIATPWYILLICIYGKEFYEPVMGYYILTRIVSPIHDQSGPWYYYVPVLMGGYFPWSAFLPSLAGVWIRMRKEKTILFLILWSVLTFLFFSVAGTKLPNYIFIMYIPLSLGLAQFFSSPAAGPKAVFTGHILIFLAAGLMYGVFLKSGKQVLGYEYLFLTPIIKTLLTLLILMPIVSILAFMIRAKSFPYVLIGWAWLVYIILVHGIITLDAAKPMKPFSEVIRANREPHDKVAVSAGVAGTNSLVFYARPPIVYCCENWEKKRFLESPQGYFYLGREEEFPRLQWYARQELYILRKQGGYILITNKVTEAIKVEKNMNAPAP